jgi:hypothetical protein
VNDFDFIVPDEGGIEKILFAECRSKAVIDDLRLHHRKT